LPVRHSRQRDTPCVRNYTENLRRVEWGCVQWRQQCPSFREAVCHGQSAPRQCRWKIQQRSFSSRQASTGVRRPPRAGADAGFVAEFELIPAPGLQTVSGDGDLRAVVAPSRGELAVFVEGKIGPLAGGRGVRAVHWSGSFAGVGVGVERDSMEGQAVGPGSSTR
jgi:hypothetical protein